MPRYRYTGIDISGRPISGEREAPNPDALLAALGNEVLSVDSIQPMELTEATAVSDAFARRLGERESAQLGGHLSEIIEAGLPLESGLEAIAAETSSRSMRRLLRKVADELAGGSDLATALKSCNTPPEMRALIRAGQRSGNTGHILEHYATNAEGAVSLRQSILIGLFYPALLLVLFAGITEFFVAWVVPEFEKVFEGFGMTLPLVTRWMIDASAFLRKAGPWIAVAIVVLAHRATRALLRAMLGELTYRRVVCRIPLVGPMFRWVAMSRFSQMLSLLIENDVPLDEALTLAGDASNDAVIRDDCRRMVAEIRAGETLEAAARRIADFPPSFVQALTWERRSMGMPDVLQSIGDMYAGRVRAAVAVIVAIIPPMLLVFIGGVMFFLIVALFMPLIELLNQLS